MIMYIREEQRGARGGRGHHPQVRMLENFLLKLWDLADRAGARTAP